MANPVGRPRKEIDKKAFENLCGLQCSLEEISFALEADMDTIERWCKRIYKKNFAEVFKLKRGSGKISLRRAQWKLATESLNPAMLIFLGKQYLGQSDAPKQALDTNPGIMPDLLEALKNADK